MTPTPIPTAEAEKRAINDALGRLRSMADEDQATWDLSPNDQRDIRLVLALIDTLRAEVGVKDQALRQIANLRSDYPARDMRAIASRALAATEPGGEK